MAGHQTLLLHINKANQKYLLIPFLDTRTNTFYLSLKSQTSLYLPLPFSCFKSQR